MFLEVEETNSWIWKSSFSLGLLGRQIHGILNDAKGLINLDIAPFSTLW
jgi:hypothetical protein